MNAKQANRAKRRQMKYGDREERRKAAASVVAQLTNEQRISRLEKLLEEERRIGAENAINYTYSTIYAAVILSVQKLYGFDADECIRLLTEVEQIVTYTLTKQEIIDRVWDECGLMLEFDAGINRIGRVDKDV